MSALPPLASLGAGGGGCLARGAARRSSWWPLAITRRSADSPRGPLRIAYYHHAFPVLSETFIQREVLELRAAGLDVTVFAHEAVGEEQFDAQAPALRADTVYLRRPSDLPPAWRGLARRHPLRLLNAFIWIRARHHVPRKSLSGDRHLFRRAIQLAGELRARGITHVHSPWASPTPRLRCSRRG